MWGFLFGELLLCLSILVLSTLLCGSLSGCVFWLLLTTFHCFLHEFCLLFEVGCCWFIFYWLLAVWDWLIFSMLCSTHFVYNYVQTYHRLHYWILTLNSLSVLLKFFFFVCFLLLSSNSLSPSLFSLILFSLFCSSITFIGRWLVMLESLDYERLVILEVRIWNLLMLCSEIND